MTLLSAVVESVRAALPAGSALLASGGVLAASALAVAHRLRRMRREVLNEVIEHDYGHGMQAFRAYPFRWTVARATYRPWLLTKLAFRHYADGRWYSRIDDTVVLGALPLPMIVSEFPKLGIRGVINLCEEYRGDLLLYQRLGLRHLWLPTIDNTTPSLQSLDRAVAFIEEHRRRGESVYVHCRAGKGRSATVVLCYLLRRHPHLDVPQAFEALRRARPGVFPAVAQRRAVAEYRRRWLLQAAGGDTAAAVHSAPPGAQASATPETQSRAAQPVQQWCQ